MPKVIIIVGIRFHPVVGEMTIGLFIIRRVRILDVFGLGGCDCRIIRRIGKSEIDVQRGLNCTGTVRVVEAPNVFLQLLRRSMVEVASRNRTEQVGDWVFSGKDEVGSCVVTPRKKNKQKQ